MYVKGADLLDVRRHPGTYTFIPLVHTPWKALSGTIFSCTNPPKSRGASVPTLLNWMPFVWLLLNGRCLCLECRPMKLLGLLVLLCLMHAKRIFQILWFTTAEGRVESMIHDDIFLTRFMCHTLMWLVDHEKRQFYCKTPPVLARKIVHDHFSKSHN